MHIREMFKKEIDLEMATVPIIESHFEYWSWQVPTSGAVIDFGGLTYDDKFIGIEYKLKDWKRAIWQAHQHRLVYDFLYILMPDLKPSEKLINEAKKVGIGVMSFSGNEITILIKPKVQRYTWGPMRRRIIDFIKIFATHDRYSFNLEDLREKANIYNSRWCQ